MNRLIKIKRPDGKSDFIEEDKIESIEVDKENECVKITYKGFSVGFDLPDLTKDRFGDKK